MVCISECGVCELCRLGVTVPLVRGCEVARLRDTWDQIFYRGEDHRSIGPIVSPRIKPEALARRQPKVGSGARFRQSSDDAVLASRPAALGAVQSSEGVRELEYQT